jgi:O-antigen/teichoic acid export membrane protein
MPNFRPYRVLAHILTGSIGVSAALALTGVATARWLGPSERGSLLLVTSISASMAAIGLMGYSLEGRRKVASEPTEPFLRKCLNRSLLSALLSLITWIAYCAISGAASDTFIAIATALLGFLLTMIFLVQSGLYGLEIFSFTSAILAGGAFAQFAAICVMHYLRALTLETSLLAFVGTSTGILILLVLKFYRTRSSTNDVSVSKGLRLPRSLAAWALFPPLVSQFFLSWDRMIIGTVSTTSAVAYFGVAATLTSLVLIFTTSVAQLVQASAQDKLRLASLRTHVRNFVAASVVCAIFLFIFAPAVITFVFGTPYANAVPVTRLLLVSVPIQAYCLIEIAVSLGKWDYRRASMAGLFGITVYVGGIMMLVPKHAEVGAASATLLAYSAISLVFLALRGRDSIARRRLAQTN